MGRHNHIRIFLLQTTSNLTATQHDLRCRTFFACLDQHRLPIIKGNRNLDCQPLEKFDHHQIKWDLCDILIMVNGKDSRTRLSTRPAVKHDSQHIGSPLTWPPWYCNAQALWTSELTTWYQNLYAHRDEYLYHLPQWQQHKNICQCLQELIEGNQRE